LLFADMCKIYTDSIYINDQKIKYSLLSLSPSLSLSLTHLSDKILTRRSGQISLARATSGPLAKPRIGPIKRAPSQHGVSRAQTSPTQMERSTNRGPRYGRNNATTRARVFNCFRSCPPSFSFLRNVSLSCLLPAR